MLPRRRIRHDVLILFFLLAATVLVYGQVKDHGFIKYDDPEYVSENAIVQKGLTWNGFSWAFTSTYQANWHPLTWLSHMLDCKLFGLRPGLHLLTNLLLHALNSALLFFVLNRMTGALWRSAFVAALFALHPLHAESVAWISERKDVLSTFFGVLAMGAYTLYGEKPGWARYSAVLLLFALGLMAKPMLVTLPVVFLLMDYWPLRRVRFGQAPPPDRPAAIAAPGSPRQKHRKKGSPAKDSPPAAGVTERMRSRRIAVEKIPLLMVSAASAIVTFYAQQKGGAMRSIEDVSLPDRISNALVSYVLYLAKTVWPTGLAFFYPLRTWPSWEVLAAAAFLLAITILAVRTARRFPYLLFGWLWYLVTLLPVIGLIRVGEASMADRYAYIPLIGPFIMLAWGAGDLTRSWPQRKRILSVAGGLVVAACMILTYIQVSHWKNNESLFLHAIHVTEKNYLAHNNLASFYIEEGRLDEAMTHLEKAIEFRPRYHLAYCNTGTILMLQGKTGEAMSYFRKTIELNPYYAPAHYSIGTVMLAQGKTDEAMENMKKAISLDPGLTEAYLELGKIYLSRGDADRAMDTLERIVQAGKFQSRVYTAIADAFIMKGKVDQALYYYLRALEWQPNDAQLRYNVGNMLIRNNRVDEAVSHFREAVRISPDYARAQNNLGSALLLQGKIDEAIYHFREAIRIDPGYTMARDNLKDALSQKKKPGR